MPIRKAWNKGLKLSEMPQYSKMGFQKGNKLADNPKSKLTQFKKGISVSPTTQFYKGQSTWNKGLKGFLAGSMSPHWKGGKMFWKEAEKKHLCSKYMAWTQAVRQRDSWKCKIGNDDCEGNLEAHHILNWRDYPELRYDINNGITLCHAHHPRKWAKEIEMVSVFTEMISTSDVI